MRSFSVSRHTRFSLNEDGVITFVLPQLVAGLIGDTVLECALSRMIYRFFYWHLDSCFCDPRIGFLRCG